MKAIMLMMSDSYGVYIPVNFLNDVDHRDWHIDQNDAAIVARGPDDESYWEAWDGILNSAYYEDNGHKYRLHQDGDLWAICPELMTNEEYQNFFCEMKPAPDNSLNITEFYNNTCPRDYAASVAERGNNAAVDTWRAACEDAPDYMILDTDDKLQAMREHVRGFGAWSDEEIAAWTDDEINALLIQMIAGDIRESCLADGGSWAMYYQQAEQGIVSGNLFSDDDGQVYYTIGD